MADERKDGGPAFPTAVLIESATGADGVIRHSSIVTDGMSLRDYFAGQFAAAWVIALANRDGRDADVVHEANRRGLEQADALLKERAK